MNVIDKHFRSLTAKFLAILVPMVCVSVLVVFSILELQYYRTERAALVDSLNRLVTLQSPALSQAAWEYDTGQIAALLAEMEHLPQLLSAVVSDELGSVLGQAGEIDAQPESPDLRSTRQLVFTRGDISENVGHLTVTFHSGEIWKNMRWHLEVNALVLLVMAATLMGVTLLAVRVVIGRPIGRLLHSIERMKTDGVREPVEWESADELGRVVEAYNEMQIKQAAAEAGRRRAEEEARDRLVELALMNRRASAVEFSASIAHELGQPLGAMVSNANAGQRWLANKTPDLEEASAAFERIVRDGHRASEVIGAIRNMFQKHAEERALHNINSIIEDTLRLLQFEFRRDQISVRRTLTEGLPRVLVDRVQVQQVILNLATNAIDAMKQVPDREHLLCIRSEADDAGRVIVEIEDSGSGIDPQKLDQIFEPFFTTKATGMGMGLSICRSIIEAHSGRLRAAPAKEHGTIFQIVLPGAKSDGPGEATTVSSTAT